MGYVLVVAAAVGYGTLGPIAELASDRGISSLTFATGRSLGALVLVAGALFLSMAMNVVPRSSVRLTRRRGLMLVLAGILTAVVNLALVESFARTSVAVGLLVFYTYPGIVALAGRYWFDERLNRREWSGIGIALAGCALVIAGPVLASDPLGLLLAACAAVGGAAWVLVIRHGFGPIEPLRATTMFMAVATMCLVLAAALAGPDTTALHRAQAGGLALVATASATSAAVPMVLFVIGMRRIGASPASALATLEPVTGVALAALLLGQLPTALQFVGGALVISAAGLLQSARAEEPPGPWVDATCEIGGEP